MDVIVLVATLLVGAVLGAWLSQYIRRPKLTVVGSGGGSDPDFHQRSVRIGNRPGLLGLRIRETVLLGKEMFDDIEKGLSIDRNPANECSAQLIDKETGQHVAPLWWRLRGRPGEVLRRVAIGSGETAELMLFARLQTEPLMYFVYEPQGDPPVPKIPRDELKFDDTREFIVRVVYSYGRQRLTFPATVQRGFDGRLSFRGPGGGGSF